jgi:hypothetical protein
MLREIIFNKYSKYGRLAYGDLYLPLCTAKEFVEECNLLKVAIIGLEFFHVQSGKVVPINPINGIDCSSLLSKYEEWNEVVKNCNKEIIHSTTIQPCLRKANGND